MATEKNMCLTLLLYTKKRIQKAGKKRLLLESLMVPTQSQNLQNTTMVVQKVHLPVLVEKLYPCDNTA